MKLKCIIVDDEPHARKLLLGLTKKYGNHLAEIIGEAEGIPGLMELLHTLKPDLVFLDLEMGSGFGFDLFSKIENQTFDVIITSAHPQYALKAFEFGIADYLIKPISPSVFVRGLERVIKIQKKDEDKLIQINTADGQANILASKIYRIEADRNYSWVHGSFGSSIFTSKNLGYFESQLASSGFFRVHHSHLVSIKKIVKIIKVDGNLEMEDGTIIPVSREKGKNLSAILKKNSNPEN
jgi:two-component system LytT family response regulator